MEFSSSLVLNEMSDEDYWDVDDDDMDFWVEVERVPFDSVEVGIIDKGAKKGARFYAETMEYERIKDGGPIPNIPEGHFVISSEDDMQTFICVIIDRTNKVVYEIFIEDMEERKPMLYEVINSLHFK
jgi:hypothetical protein